MIRAIGALATFANGIAYAIVLALAWVVLAAAWRTAEKRLRLAMLLVTGFAVVIPFAFTLLSFQHLGFGWQGRYTWPVAMGTLLIAGLALDRSNVVPNATWSRVAAGAAGLAVGAATLRGQLGLLQNELAPSPLAHDPAWLRPPAMLVVLLTLGGFALIAVAAQVGRPPPVETSRVADEEETATPANLSR